MPRKNNKQLSLLPFAFKLWMGFTLLEIIITISLLAIIVTAIMASYLGYQKNVELNTAAKEIVENLRDAQNRAITGEGNLKWGIHFENPATGDPFYARFSGPSYVTPDEIFYLPIYLQFNTPSQGNSLDIIFDKLKGTIATDQTIVIALKASPTNTKTITVTKEGRITSD